MAKKTKPPKRARYKSYAFTDATGKLYARVQIRLPNGTYKTYKRRAKNLTHAEQLADEMFQEYSDRGQAYIDSKSMKLRDLAEWYKETYVIAPVYKSGSKVAGLRTWEFERRKIDRIFGMSSETGQPTLPNVPIDQLDEDMLRRYRLARLKDVGIATVNRDLETVRAMLRQAKRKKWIKDMPEFTGLIEKSLETRRTVTVTPEQETAILTEAKNYTGAPRLYALILALRDSGARPNELYPVNDYSDDKTLYEPWRWRDIMQDGEIVSIARVVSYKGRQREERLCVLTERMRKALEDLWNYLREPKRDARLLDESRALPDNFVFPQTSFQSAWEVVRIKAGVPDLRLRDLRRDWRTRLGRLGMPDMIAQRAAGHRTLAMSYHYQEFDHAAAMQIKEMLDRDNGDAIDAGGTIH